MPVSLDAPVSLEASTLTPVSVDDPVSVVESTFAPVSLDAPVSVEVSGTDSVSNEELEHAPRAPRKKIPNKRFTQKAYHETRRSLDRLTLEHTFATSR